MDELRHVDHCPGDKQPRLACFISHFIIQSSWEFCGSNLVPTDIHSSETLDPFRAYYVTKYIDHHAHTLVF